MSADGDFFDFPLTLRLYHGPVEREWVESALAGPPATVIEFGSYDGGDGVRYRHWWPTAAIHSIEADPGLYFLLSTLVGPAAGIRTHHAAISDKDGTAGFYRSFDAHAAISSSGSLYRRLPSDRRNPDRTWSDDPITVPTMRLDTFCNLVGFSSIDFLHVDVEGAEYDAIIGLGALRPRLVLLEKHAPVEEGHAESEVCDLMRSLGYRLVIEEAHDTFWVRTE